MTPAIFRIFTAFVAALAMGMAGLHLRRWITVWVKAPKHSSARVRGRAGTFTTAGILLSSSGAFLFRFLYIIDETPLEPRDFISFAVVSLFAAGLFGGMEFVRLSEEVDD